MNADLQKRMGIWAGSIHRRPSLARRVAVAYAVDELGWSDCTAYRYRGGLAVAVVWVDGLCDGKPAAVKLMLNEVGIIIDEQEVNRKQV